MGSISLDESENLPQVVPQTNPANAIMLAGKAADACRQIVNQTAITIQGKKYVPVEGWQSIANVMGFFISADESAREYNPKGEMIGWKAKGYVRDRQGVIIGTGEGFVGLDEKDSKGRLTWGARAEYAGRAMAQTRAQSRAGRAVFAFIVTMIGGLKTTPAEEMSASDIDPEPEASPEQKALHASMAKELTEAYKKYVSLIEFPQDFPAKIDTLEMATIDELRTLKREMKAIIDAYTKNPPRK